MFAKQNNEKKNSRIPMIILVAVVVLSLLGGMFARYIQDSEQTNQTSAGRFYFTVDVLGDTNTDEDLSTTVDLYGGGAKSFTFRAQNYFDTSRITEYDVAYTAAVDASSTYDGATLSTSGGTLTGGQASYEDITLTIPAGYADGSKVVVKVASTAPYAKEMTLTFNLHTEAAKVSYYVEDAAGSATAKLYLLTNTDLAANAVAVDWSSIGGDVLMVDMTNPYVGTATKTFDGDYVEALTVTEAISAGSVVEISFFKADASQNYTIAETEIVKTNGTYTAVISQN